MFQNSFRRLARYASVGRVGLLTLVLTSSLAALSQAGLFCDQCCENSCDPDGWCATCQRVCEDKTTKKWVYWCREKQYCLPCCPRLFESEECMECECEPRVKRVLIKKQVKETKPHLSCKLIKPAKAAPAEKAAPLPPAPAADKPPRTAQRDIDVTRTSGRRPVR
ncbi:MAG: hypothetical protein NT069_30255 [Planctomycetota bacterium]|nr:hypothetical protein [Planctomycetota bacterium]